MVDTEIIRAKVAIRQALEGQGYKPSRSSLRIIIGVAKETLRQIHASYGPGYRRLKAQPELAEALRLDTIQKQKEARELVSGDRLPPAPKFWRKLKSTK